MTSCSAHLKEELILRPVSHRGDCRMP